MLMMEKGRMRSEMNARLREEIWGGGVQGIEWEEGKSTDAANKISSSHGE
jgi:hypothetical protein